MTVAAFTVSLRLDGAAFTDAPAEAVADVLDRVAERLRNGRTAALVLDVNGNRCGSWALDLDPETEAVALPALPE